jgi:hypothetical protein
MVAKFSAEPLDLPKTVGRPVAMVAKFSAEPLDLPKDSIGGTVEEMTESIVAMLNCNNGRPSGEGTTKSTPNKVNSKTKQYLRDSLTHQSDEERAEIEPVLMRYAHVFHDEESGEFRKTDLVRHRIETGNAPPIRKAPYRVPHSLRGEMEEQVDNILNRGVIRESTSPWNAPAILVPKKSSDGKRKYLFCVDYRALNKVTKFDSYPLPLLEDATSSLAGSQYFSVLDCHSGFWQIEIRDEDKEKTAFTVPSGSDVRWKIFHRKFSRTENFPQYFSRKFSLS